jgi:DNA-binding transcriptional regulator YiaG
MATITIPPATADTLAAMERARADLRQQVPDSAGDPPVFRIRAAVRARIMAGTYQPGDLAALRQAFGSLSQSQFAARLGISVSTLQNWEQGRTTPDGPARALLSLVAKRPRVMIEDLVGVA